MQAAEVAREAGAKRLLSTTLVLASYQKTSANCARMRPAFLKMSMSSKIWKKWRSKMRTILITGASGGLAQEMVKLLPEDRLILLGRNQEKLEQLYASHPQTECIGIDITDSSAVQDLVEDLYQRYGQIDILVNNAGYGIFEDF